MLYYQLLLVISPIASPWLVITPALSHNIPDPIWFPSHQGMGYIKSPWYPHFFPRNSPLISMIIHLFVHVALLFACKMFMWMGQRAPPWMVENL